MTIKELANKCHADAKSLGWYDDGKTKSDLETLMMVVTEVSEAVDEIRKPDAKVRYIKNGKPEGYGVEIADTIIRLLDYCSYKDINIESIILEKLKYNLTRGYRHGDKKF
ncbi:MAG: hypothetical protein DRI84_07925 [Bacteroidetes bacterium]|nr:MAG: hypothetical protein DRI84_07925 [Bacteroidota bacterium]